MLYNNPRLNNNSSKNETHQNPVLVVSRIAHFNDDANRGQVQDAAGRDERDRL
jgi:hypothetical protein